ncbi:MAG: hypothetical protein FRX49_02698 [Trebouxia sp. A1-2]|nr:MAG: hypothetical protein FRX49_02698 [Trebouxia sp. A1-2]
MAAERREAELKQALQNVQRQRVQPSRPGLDRINQQHKQIKATLRDLDSACPAARAELLADWPSALESSKLESALPRLHGTQTTQMQRCSARH